MKNLKWFLVLFLVSAISWSCKEDDPKPKGEFSTGVWVINEGAFQKSDGTIGYFNSSTKEVKQDLFGLKNNSRALGDIVQSATVDGDHAYIVVNNDNKVEVVNSNTFEAEYTLNNLKLPRYFTTFNGKGYVTEWVSFTEPGRVSVVNLETKQVETTIAAGNGADNIIALNGKLYVSNNFSNTVSVIDPAQNREIKKIEVSNSPGKFVIDSDNKLWVICGGNNLALFKINPNDNSVENRIDLGMRSSRLAINRTKDQLYYVNGKNVYKMSTKTPVVPTSAFITVSTAVSIYGIDVDPGTDVIYIGDSKAFQVNGTVYRYDASGTAIDDFTSGKGPNGFVFRY
jgi:YVTN family beta-propeller protein